MPVIGIKNLVVMLIIAVISYAILFFLPASAIDLKLTEKLKEKLQDKEKE